MKNLPDCVKIKEKTKVVLNLNKKNKLFYGANADFATKGVVLLVSCLLALIFGKKSKKKKRGTVYRVKKNYNTLNGLINTFYINKLKKETDPDDFPIKIETAEIIDI